LNVSDAPAASDDVNVKVHSLEVVFAEAPLPLRGPNFAPEGTASFVQWSPAGRPKETAKPCHGEGPGFSTVIVPQ
jgi:hypothetical protein